MLDTTTLLLIGILLLSIYAASKFILYIIRLIRGASNIKVISGRIKYVRAVSRRCVQFQLIGDDRIYEMYSEEHWVMYKNDEVRVAGYVDMKGKTIVYAYFNETKSVYGHARLIHTPWLIVFGAIYAMGGMIYFHFYTYFLAAIAALVYGLVIIQPDLEKRRATHLLSK